MPYKDITQRRACNAKSQRQWAQTHPDLRRERNRQWRLTHQDVASAISRRTYEKHHEKIKADVKAYNLGLRQALLDAYGNQCECCHDTTPEFLTLDHINGGGSQERKAGKKTYNLIRELRDQGWPKENHRLLCYNCNMSLGRYGYCPHQLVTAS